MQSSLPRTTIAGLVYASTAVVWTSYSLLSVTLPFRFEALGLSVVEYGVAIAVFALGMLATESVWGVLAFRIGKLGPILVLGSAVLIVYGCIALSTSFIALTIELAVFGMLIIFPVPLFRWMALVARGPGTEGSGSGRFGLFFGCGMVVGSAVGPYLYVTVGFESLAAIILGTYALGLALMAVLPWRDTHLPRSEPGAISLVRRVITVPFLYAAGLAAVSYLCFTLIVNFLQIYSVGVFHGTPADAGYVIGLARATLLMSGFMLGSSVDRFGPARTSPLGFLLVAAGAFGTLFSVSYGEMIASTMVLAAGLGWLSASLLPLGMKTVPVTLQGTAVGVFGSFEDLGLLVGPVVISTAYAAYGSRSIFILVGVIAAAAAIFPLIVHRIALHGSGRGAGLTKSVRPNR
ncbi:MAG TPA: MFS transporter [Thermoplasmata archaeon]|nr:MFS transporter [Thermoplasmata archaeon]